jgi:hypothetical protein
VRRLEYRAHVSDRAGQPPGILPFTARAAADRERALYHRRRYGHRSQSNGRAESEAVFKSKLQDAWAVKRANNIQLAEVAAGNQEAGLIHRPTVSA